MACAWDDVQLFRLSGTLVSIFAKFFRMRLTAGDEQHRAWRDRFNIIERVEVHKLPNAAQHGFGRQFFLLAFWRVAATRCTVKIEEFSLNRRC
ncbi:hypothetical protein D3C73_1404630 [compost metagenome]